MCSSQLTPSPSGLMHHLPGSRPHPLFFPLELGELGRTKPNCSSSPLPSWGQRVSLLPVSPPPLLLLTLGISLK
jgi:hypothetical protein